MMPTTNSAVYSFVTKGGNLPATRKVKRGAIRERVTLFVDEGAEGSVLAVFEDEVQVLLVHERLSHVDHKATSTHLLQDRFFPQY